MGLINDTLKALGYEKVITVPDEAIVVKENLFEKKANDRQGIAENPSALAFSVVNSQMGLRKPATQVTMQTLRRMSRTNWVDRTCITTLRDEITAIPWEIIPINPKAPFNEQAQLFYTRLLHKPNPANENWRTFIDKVMEDILVVDAGVIEKVRDQKNRVVQLWTVDGASIKPVFDIHGIPGEPAYLQFIPGQKENKPVAAWDNEDLIYMVWNPQGAVDTFGYGLSPVEAGLVVGTSFLYAEAYNLSFFRQNTIPPVLINVGKQVPQDEIERFRTFLTSEMMGEQGFHTPMLFSGNEGWGVEQLMKNPQDMEYSKYVEWQMRWKVALYRMSPQDIGFTLDQYKVEGQVQQQLSKNKAIDSLKGVIKEYIDTEIINDYGYLNMGQNLQFMWIDTDAVDPLVQAQVDKIYLSSGVSSINEVRADLGKDPIEGGTQPTILAGSTVIKVPGTVLSDDGDEQNSTDVQKTFDSEEGLIVSLNGNATAICWMDDRGITQPFFVTDGGKKRGFTIKPTFLDDKKDQKPPEAKVASLLRAMEVNTPEVQIMSYDDVLKLMPNEIYPRFTAWINLEPPFDSMEWRGQWGDTRMSNYFIVNGFIDGRDLGNEELQKEMAVAPEAYLNAIKDFARVWIAERRFYLGDRKPGHYLITSAGNGFGVDYSFYEDKKSWDDRKHFLPVTLHAINPKLLDMFQKAVIDETKNFGIMEKSFIAELEDVKKNFRPGNPDNWEKIAQLTESKKKLAEKIQKKLYVWSKKTTNIAVKGTVLKTNSFNPDSPYLTDGETVFQGTAKYSINVLEKNLRPSLLDLQLQESDYLPFATMGAEAAQQRIKDAVPHANFKKTLKPNLTQAFTKRANLVTGSVSDTLKSTINTLIVQGMAQGDSYGMIGDSIQQAVGVDPANPDMPGWRATMIARTESQWAVNEGMLSTYQDLGVEQVNIVLGSNACEICQAAAEDNPYDVSDSGVLPAHPSCECDWVGDWSSFLQKSDFQKDWVTINGNHVFIGDAAGGHTAGGGSINSDGSISYASGFVYTPATGLSSQERQVERNFGDQIGNHLNQTIQEYKDQNGNVLNVDLAKNLSKDYNMNNDSRARLSAVVQEPSSALIKDIYAKDLASPTADGKLRMVLFTAGGGGSGKSAAMQSVPDALSRSSQANIVFDGTMANFNSSRSKMDQALASGHQVQVLYINRGVEPSFQSMMSRAEVTGRTVPLSAFVDAHVGAPNSMQMLASHYAGNPNVNFGVIDNTDGKGGAFKSTLDSLSGVRYNPDTLVPALNASLDQAYANGKISQSVYSGIKGF